MALVPTYLDIHIKPLISHISLCWYRILLSCQKLKLEFYILQPLVNLQRNRHCFGDISRNFLEALYFCVTHWQSNYFFKSGKWSEIFCFTFGSGFWSGPVMQNFFSNLAPSGGEEGANSGAPWYMKYAGKAAGIGGGLGKFIACEIVQISTGDHGPFSDQPFTIKILYFFV